MYTSAEWLKIVLLQYSCFLPFCRIFLHEAPTTVNPPLSVRRSLSPICFYFKYHFNPLTPHCYHMGTATKHSVPDLVKSSFVIFDIRALWRSGLSVKVPGCQKLQMTGLTRSVTGCFIAGVPIWQQWASKG